MKKLINLLILFVSFIMTTSCELIDNHSLSKQMNMFMGGTVGDNELHMGYTRLICFSGDSPNTSVQDFIWYNSNEDVVTVSEFGTILGVGEDKTYIYGTYKYNSNFVAEFYIYAN